MWRLNKKSLRSVRQRRGGLTAEYKRLSRIERKKLGMAFGCSPSKRKRRKLHDPGDDYNKWIIWKNRNGRP